MKFFYCILLGLALVMGSSQMSSATGGDWKKRKCERFLANLEDRVDDEYRAGYSDDRDEARHGHLSHQERKLRRQVRYCIRLVYGHGGKPPSPNYNHEGDEWEEAYNSHDDDDLDDFFDDEFDDD